jgi:hypothetical protein
MISVLIEKSHITAKLFDFLVSCMWALSNEDLFKHLLSKFQFIKCIVDFYYDVNTTITDVDVLKFISRKDLLRYST